MSQKKIHGNHFRFWPNQSEFLWLNIDQIHYHWLDKKFYNLVFISCSISSVKSMQQVKIKHIYPFSASLTKCMHFDGNATNTISFSVNVWHTKVDLSRFTFIMYSWQSRVLCKLVNWDWVLLKRADLCFRLKIYGRSTFNNLLYSWTVTHQMLFKYKVIDVNIYHPSIVIITIIFNLVLKLASVHCICNMSVW